MLSKAGILQLGNYFIALLRIDSPFQGAGFRLQKSLNPYRCATSPFQGDTACITFRRVAPLLRFSKKILQTFRHGG